MVRTVTSTEGDDRETIRRAAAAAAATILPEADRLRPFAAVLRDRTVAVADREEATAEVDRRPDTLVGADRRRRTRVGTVRRTESAIGTAAAAVGLPAGTDRRLRDAAATTIADRRREAEVRTDPQTENEEGLEVAVGVRRLVDEGIGVEERRSTVRKDAERATSRSSWVDRSLTFSEENDGELVSWRCLTNSWGIDE